MNKVPPKPRKNQKSTREELQNLNKEELIDKIIQLEAHNFQLKNIISKNVSECINKDKKQKPFDFSKTHSRPILLRILYFGWNYQGFVVQEDTTETIEHHLFSALSKACLIERRETAEYHRCGRTDKGVSSFGQVISLKVRSKHHPSVQNDPTSLTTELEYCKILNRLLPKDIRAVAWMPVPEENVGFSARFDCKKRQYKYYFPKSDLNIQSMKEACSLLVGSHDFRNFCKMDVGNGVTEFVRTILTADICAVDNNDTEKPTSMFYLHIEGNAFLWHQIRCVMAVLLLVGSGSETKDVVTQLLDKDTHNRKPQYNMALDVPLNLFQCSYDIEQSNIWIFEKIELGKLISHLQGEWTIQNIKATMIKDCLHNLENKYSNLQEMTMETDIQKDTIISYAECLTQGVKPKNYTPLLKRGKCSTLEEKIEHYQKRRKVSEKINDNAP